MRVDCDEAGGVGFGAHAGAALEVVGGVVVTVEGEHDRCCSTDCIEVGGEVEEVGAVNAVDGDVLFGGGTFGAASWGVASARGWRRCGDGEQETTEDAARHGGAWRGQKKSSR